MDYSELCVCVCVIIYLELTEWCRASRPSVHPLGQFHPIRGQNEENFDKSSKYLSYEPVTGMHWYLVWSILGVQGFNFVQMKSLESCVAPPQGLKRWHWEWEMLKKSSSQELLHQMGQYSAWITPKTRRFKFVQIKSLWSQMATP